MELNHTDDAGMQLQKLAQVQNELTDLYEELKVRGAEFNLAYGRFSETKAKISIKKTQINTLKTLVKAEGSHL